MTDFQVSKRSIRHGLAAVTVLAAALAAPAARAQTAPLSYAVPDSSAWSDVLKNDRKASTSRTKATAEPKKKSAPIERQAKSRPAKTDGASAAREAFASAPPQKPVRAGDVRIVSPDELNEIDQMAGQ